MSKLKVKSSTKIFFTFFRSKSSSSFWIRSREYCLTPATPRDSKQKPHSYCLINKCYPLRRRPPILSGDECAFCYGMSHKYPSTLWAEGIFWGRRLLSARLHFRPLFYFGNNFALPFRIHHVFYSHLFIVPFSPYWKGEKGAFKYYPLGRLEIV